MITPQRFTASIWSLGAFVVVLAFVAWFSNLGDPITLYDMFPILGLLAFSLMWTHYISGALRQYFKQEYITLKTYFSVTSGIVLALILLHPGLFYLQLFIDGLGLPPQSYLQAYTETASRIALSIATVSLFVFLSFELRSKFKKASWWKYVEYANTAAMFGIFYHALTLGGELMSGWFRIVWFIYGITLVIAIAYTRFHSRKTV